MTPANNPGGEIRTRRQMCASQSIRRTPLPRCTCVVTAKENAFAVTTMHLSKMRCQKQKLLVVVRAAKKLLTVTKTWVPTKHRAGLVLVAGERQASQTLHRRAPGAGMLQ